MEEETVLAAQKDYAHIIKCCTRIKSPSTFKYLFHFPQYINSFHANKASLMTLCTSLLLQNLSYLTNTHIFMHSTGCLKAKYS